MDDTDRTELRAAIQHLNHIIERQREKGVEVRLEVTEAHGVNLTQAMNGMGRQHVLRAFAVEPISGGK